VHLGSLGDGARHHVDAAIAARPGRLTLDHFRDALTSAKVGVKLSTKGWEYFDEAVARKLVTLGRLAVKQEQAVASRSAAASSSSVPSEAGPPPETPLLNPKIEPKPPKAEPIPAHAVLHSVLHGAQSLLERRRLADVQKQVRALKLAKQQAAYWKKRALHYKKLALDTEHRRVSETTYVLHSKRRKKDAQMYKTSVRGGLLLALRRNLGQSGGKVLTQTVEACVSHQVGELGKRTV
jgi:hypothetical protein